MMNNDIGETNENDGGENLGFPVIKQSLTPQISKLEETSTYLERANHVNDAMSLLRTEAKLYIVANCDKVSDWSSLYLSITNGNNIDNSNKLESFDYAPYEPKFYNKWINYSANIGVETSPHEYKDESVKTVTDPVYDDFDGDFSITINGLEWWWIDYDAVMRLAIFIERSLSPEKYT